jgi:hypothetical protein
MLDIHEFLREPDLSGGVMLPGFSALARLSNAGRLMGVL